MSEEMKNDQSTSAAPSSASETPTYQAVPQQPAAVPPASPSPTPAPAAWMPTPLMQLTGGMKFGWFVVGALLGIGGILVAWLANVDKVPQVKSDAVKWTIIGFVVWIVLGIIMGMLIGGMMAAMITAAAGSYSYY